MSGLRMAGVNSRPTGPAPRPSGAESRPTGPAVLPPRGFVRRTEVTLRTAEPSFGSISGSIALTVLHCGGEEWRAVFDELAAAFAGWSYAAAAGLSEDRGVSANRDWHLVLDYLLCLAAGRLIELTRRHGLPPAQEVSVKRSGYYGALPLSVPSHGTTAQYQALKGAEQ